MNKSTILQNNFWSLNRFKEHLHVKDQDKESTFYLKDVNLSIFSF